MKVRRNIEQLQVGHYVHLPLKWDKHPFLLNSFKIKNEQQLQIIKHLGLTSVTINALKSDVLDEPEHVTTTPTNSETDSSEADEKVLATLWSKKREGTQKLTAIEDRISFSKEVFENTIKDVQNIFDRDALANNPSISTSISIVSGIYNNLNKDGKSTIHLMNDSVGYERLHYHSLNVSLLSVLICQAKGYTAKQCQLVAFAALYHDIGKINLPASLLSKTEPLDEYEVKRLSTHLDIGLKISAKIPNFPSAALKVIGQHHELNDGSGYPKGVSKDDINQLSRVLILANAYDNLCNRSEASMSPHNALTYLYNDCQAQYAQQDVMALISVVGVYPPGTLVELSDGQLGVVISSNDTLRLSPYVLVYDQNIPRDEAAILNISEYGLTISRVLDADELTLDQFNYLNPSSQSTYFIDVE